MNKVSSYENKMIIPIINQEHNIINKYYLNTLNPKGNN